MTINDTKSEIEPLWFGPHFCQSPPAQGWHWHTSLVAPVHHVLASLRLPIYIGGMWIQICTLGKDDQEMWKFTGKNNSLSPQTGVCLTRWPSSGVCLSSYLELYWNYMIQTDFKKMHGFSYIHQDQRPIVAISYARDFHHVIVSGCIIQNAHKALLGHQWDCGDWPTSLCKLTKVS